MQSEKRHSFQEFREAEQESEQQQREQIVSEIMVLRQELQEAEQEQENEQQERACIESEKRLLRKALHRSQEDLMVQGNQSMCPASTTVLGVGAARPDSAGLQAETPPTASSLLDAELNEAQKDAQELRTHVHVGAIDMPSSGDPDQVVKREFKRLRVD